MAVGEIFQQFRVVAGLLLYLEAAVVEPPVLAVFEEVAVAVGELECGVQRIGQTFPVGNVFGIRRFNGRLLLRVEPPILAPYKSNHWSIKR
jgi:hypothetical protein